MQRQEALQARDHRAIFIFIWGSGRAEKLTIQMKVAYEMTLHVEMKKIDKHFYIKVLVVYQDDVDALGLLSLE